MKLSLKHSTCKSKLHIAQLLMVAEMQNKHFERKKNNERFETYWGPIQILCWLDII